MRAIVGCLLLAGSLTLHGSARADLIPLFDPNFPANLPGGKNFVFDTETGLEWFYTKGIYDIAFASFEYMGNPKYMTYEHVSGVLGTGIYANMRYASLAEVHTYFAHWGLPVGTYPTGDSIISSNTYSTIAQIGITDSFDPRYFRSMGITGDPGPDGVSRYKATAESSSHVGVADDGTWFVYYRTSTRFLDGLTSDRVPSDGHWIVREVNPVPEPSTLGLLVMGCAAVLVFRLRRR